MQKQIVTKNRFTKHYFIGSKRVASRIGSGSFNNMYGVNGSYVTAGQQDYAERLSQIESQKEDYYKKLGIAPGIPTMKGSYADPENTGVAVHHPNGTQTTYKYDLLGRKLSVNHPDAGEVTCTYDAAGNLLTKLTAELKKSISDKAPITYTYDYERLSEVLYPENLFNRVTYTYGEAGDDHGRAGRLALVEDASGGEAYYYGKMGEVVKTVRTVMASVADIRTYVYGAEGN